MYFVQFYNGIEPYYILLATYVTSSIIVIVLNQISRSSKPNLAGLIEKFLSNSRIVVYLTFLSVIDLIIFMLFVSNASLTTLEVEYQSSFLFYGLIVFFIPMTLTKFYLEPKAKQIEEGFWMEYKRSLTSTKPSTEFALFILARIQMKLHPLTRVQQPADSADEVKPFSEQITTTTFPMDYNQPDLEHQSQNSLFNTEEIVVTEETFTKYFKEIYSIVPGLEELANLRPVNIKPELFLSIIIEKTIKDPQMLQMFKENAG